MRVAADMCACGARGRGRLVIKGIGALCGRAGLMYAYGGLDNGRRGVALYYCGAATPGVFDFVNELRGARADRRGANGC